MSMTLSSCSSPSMRSYGAGGSRGAVQLPRRRLVERVDDQRRLAAAGDAGDAGERAERDRRGDVLEIVAAGADDFQLAAGCGDAARRRRRHEPLRRKDIAPVSELGSAHDLRRRPLGDDLAAVDAGAGADVDDVIGGEDRVLVMLDDDHRVAEFAQAPAASRAAARCRAGAGRSTARRARRARRSGPSRSARRGGCAGFRRPTSVPEARDRVR